MMRPDHEFMTKTYEIGSLWFSAGFPRTGERWIVVGLIPPTADHLWIWGVKWYCVRTGKITVLGAAMYDGAPNTVKRIS